MSGSQRRGRGGGFTSTLPATQNACTSMTGTSGEEGTEVAVPPRNRPASTVPSSTTSTPAGTTSRTRPQSACAWTTTWLDWSSAVVKSSTTSPKTAEHVSTGGTTQRPERTSV